MLAHHRMQRAQHTGPEAFETRHMDFHMALLANADAPIVLKFCAGLYGLNIRHRFLAGNARHYNRRDVTEEHAGILAAAVARDGDLASTRLIAHDPHVGTGHSPGQAIACIGKAVGRQYPMPHHQILTHAEHDVPVWVPVGVAAAVGTGGRSVLSRARAGGSGRGPERMQVSVSTG